MAATPSHLIEPARHTPVAGDYDVVVLGGGPAGIAAAVAAGRHGRKVLLVERYGFLGGMGTAAGVTNFCGLHANAHGAIKQVVHGVAGELLARIDRLGGLNAPHLVLGKIYAQSYDTAAYKCAADALLLSNNVEILFHALATDVVMDGENRVKALLIETKSGRSAILGRAFIDCSGDGDLAAFAGAAYEKGDAGGHLLYPTMMFRVSGVDAALAGEAWRTIPALMEAAEKRGVKFPRKGAIVRPQKHSGEWRINVTQVKNRAGTAADGTDAHELSAGEIEGRHQAMAFFEFLRREAPGFADSYV
ncbi:MAG: FAD-dependent oxidoreductase, partial [Pseudolabrys sp.]